MAESLIDEFDVTPATLIDTFERAAPETMVLLNPRRTPTPPGYMDMRFWSTTVTAIVSSLGWASSSSRARSFSLGWASLAHDFRYPHLVVTPELAAAFARTELDDSVDILGLDWPFPAFVLSIPRSLAPRTDTGVEVSQFICAKCPPAHEPIPIAKPFAHLHPGHTHLEPPTGSFMIGGAENAYPFANHHYVGSPQEVLSGSGGLLVTRAIRVNGDVKLVEDFADAAEEHDTGRLLKRAAHWLALTLLYLRGRRVEIAAPFRPVRLKRGKSREALYEPIWLGKGYRAPRRQDEEGHSSPVAHVRRGHVRMVPHGPMNQVPRPTRWTWIEPVLVGANS